MSPERNIDPENLDDFPLPPEDFSVVYPGAIDIDSFPIPPDLDDFPLPPDIAEPGYSDSEIFPVSPLEVDEHVPALLGLRRRILELRLKRSGPRTEALTGDAEFYPRAAQDSLGTILMNPAIPKKHAYGSVDEPYNPLKTFHLAHRATREEINTKKTANREYDVAHDTAPRARTSLQEQAGMRANLRVDAINKRKNIIGSYKSLYPDINLGYEKDEGKEDVKDVIKNGRFTRGQRKAIRGADKQVRKAEKSNKRLLKRLNQSAKGNDMPGLYVGARAEEKKERHDKMTRRRARYEALQPLADARKDRRADRRRRTIEDARDLSKRGALATGRGIGRGARGAARKVGGALAKVRRSKSSSSGGSEE